MFNDIKILYFSLRTPEESFSVFSDKEVVLPGQRNKEVLPPRRPNNVPSQPRPTAQVPGIRIRILNN